MKWCTFHSQQIDYLVIFVCFPNWNKLFEYWPWIFGCFHVENITFLSEMRVRRSHHQLHVESLWTTWTLWKLAQDTWLKLFPAAMTTGFLVKCELSTFPLLILHDNTAEGNAWNIIKYHQLDGMACLFFLAFFRVWNLNIVHANPHQSLIGKALMRPYLGSSWQSEWILWLLHGHWDKKPTNGMEIASHP